MIDVAFTRAELRSAQLIVVLDVLRATSTAITALAAGYERLLFADSLVAAQRLRTPDRILAGERRCRMPAGFDQGNSPRDARVCRARELVLATTNGAPTVIRAAELSPLVLLGALCNLDATVATLRERLCSRETTIVLACSGTDGAPALEDVYAAGLIATRLPGPRTDATRVAEAVARGYDGPHEALACSEDAETLRAADLAGDIDDCASTSTLSCVPIVVGSRSHVAIVEGVRSAQRPAGGGVITAPPPELGLAPARR